MAADAPSEVPLAAYGAEALPHAGTDLGVVRAAADASFSVRQARTSLWLVVSLDGREVAALRLGDGAHDIDGSVTRADASDETVFEFGSQLGAFRTKIAFPGEGGRTIRCTTSLLPLNDVVLRAWARDLHVLGSADGRIHTAQRGLRSGIVYASTSHPTPWTAFYFQNFSSLTDYFAATKKSPSGTVGGRWPELGYAPPCGEDCVLPGSRELVVSDVFLTITAGVPETPADVAARYLDLLAETYLCLPRPSVAYHDWPTRAQQTLRDLSLSPACTFIRRGRPYAMPYVGDATKPPESMVQLTLAVNTAEYARWRGETNELARALAETVGTFFDEEVGSLVRWLPGEHFGAQREQNMNHDDMDSWYLHHALFNASRLAPDDPKARDAFVRSLPFVMQVARRFKYRWPIFFNLRTLDVVRAESEPGKGGERDVAGLYALVMLRAHDLLGEAQYLEEAERALTSLQGLGFSLGYQMNTVGFAAEAAMRTWKRTKNPLYLELSEICMANLWDNTWLWQCEYGAARHYRTFGGLFPLRDAPYVAAYEELEAQAKFHDYLDLAGEDLRPSLRVLLAEYRRYSLDRGWYYYPDTLPADVTAEKPRNGTIERALAIPLEGMQDGWERSGQVGQEVYGAGLALVYATRHYVPIAGSGCTAFSDYPMYDVRVDAGTRRASWRLGGDPRCTCAVRIIPNDVDAPPPAVSLAVHAGRVAVPLPGEVTVEGHAAFTVRGGQSVELTWGGAKGVEIGGVRRGAART